MGESGDFATMLRRLRESAALTQEELAERAGLTVKAVGALERGERRRPYPNTVRALAQALELDEAARDGLAAAARPPAPQTPPAARVPVPPATPLFGRDDELAEVLSLVRDKGVRLLTVTGPGGVGKTSLAFAVTQALATDFPGRVAVAELAAVRDVQLVLPTVGHALGLAQIDPAQPVEALAAHLVQRPTLLVLDNLEHLLAVAPDVAMLLARCADLVVLATSRSPLRVRPEHDYPLGPLAVPGAGDVAAVASSPAAQVFLDRAQAANPGLSLTAATAPAVAAICHRLAGLPLALELAAAHARLLPPAALLDRLDSSLGMARSRDLPERHRTMAATLDWSHDLLTRGEQRLLRRLSVFAGGFTLEAAEQVAGDEGDLLGLLGGLVDQSLVSLEAGHEARYRMLEPVRQYAAERLRAAAETGDMRGRHAAYAVRLARGAGEGLRGPDQAAWLSRLASEHDNLRAALGTLRDRGDLGSMARLMADTWLYWALRGHAGEGKAWIESVVDDFQTADGTASDRSAAYLALAGLRYAVGDVPGTRAAALQAAELARARDGDESLTEALVLLGGATVFAGDPEAAAGPLAEAVRRAEAAGHAFALAQAAFTQGQRLFQVGSVAAGAAHLAEAEAIARRVGLPFTLASVLNMRAVVAEVMADDDTALEQLTEAAELAAEVGTTWTLVYTLPALAVLAARRGQPELAAVLFAAGVATAQTSGLAVTFPPSREGAEHWLAVVRSSLDGETWQRAQDAGRALPPATVADLAARIRRPAPS